MLFTLIQLKVRMCDDEEAVRVATYNRKRKRNIHQELNEAHYITRYRYSE